MRRAVIVGLSGLTLQPQERAFLTDARPAGIIIFARNVSTPEQLSELIHDARDAVADPDCLVLVDQEGGRVQRLRPPYWTALPAAAKFDQHYEKHPDTAKRVLALVARLCAAELREMGINTNCAPCLDIPVAGAHDVIGDRAYGNAPARVAELGRIVAESFTSAGILPVAKHIPGHGRARVDSHKDLPIVETSLQELRATDFAPFRMLNDLPAAMTAHVVYQSIDPSAPATISDKAITDYIRGEIGFDGLLMSDDLSMSALSGTIGDRARAVRRAGCDLVLHCNGNLNEMQAAADHAGNLAGRSLERFETACAIVNKDIFPPDMRALREQTREFLEVLQ